MDNIICTPPSYERLTALINFFVEARRCFFRGMIKYNVPGFCNRFFKYQGTTIRYTIVRLLTNAILIHMLSSFWYTVINLDTGQMFWSSLPCICQFHHYLGRCFWHQYCCNLSRFPVFCTLGIKYLCSKLVKRQYHLLIFNSTWFFISKKYSILFLNYGIHFPMLSNIFMIKSSPSIFLPSLWILRQTSYNLFATNPIKNIPHLHETSSCVWVVNYLMVVSIEIFIIAWKWST